MRSRMISSDFWQSESVAELAPIQRLIWIGLWGAATEEGVGRAHPRLLAAEMFPFDDIDEMALHIFHTMTVLADGEMLIFYREKGKKTVYYQIRNFDRYQSLRPSKNSKYPLPTSENVEIIDVQEFCKHLQANADKCMQMQANARPREGKGREVEVNMLTHMGEIEISPEHANVDNSTTGTVKASVKAERPSRKTPTSRKYSEQFEKFWNAYPPQRRREKPAAYNAFNRALTRASFDDIMTGLDAYKRTEDPMWSPRPAKWLKTDSWNDYTTTNASVEEAETLSPFKRATGRFADLARRLLADSSLNAESQELNFDHVLSLVKENPTDTTKAINLIRELEQAQ